jgi:hypothetical protein
MPAAYSLALAKGDPFPVKINVLPSRPPHFAPPGARVGGKDEHWIKEWVQSLASDVLKQFPNFRQGQKNGIPEFRLLLV